MHSDTDDSHRHYAEWKDSGTKDSMPYDSVKLGQAKLIYSENQNNCCLVRGDCLAKDIFWSDGNVRYLDRAVSYTGVSICRDAC